MARKSTGKPVKKAGTRVRTPKPIALYYWSTPNGHKISIMLEELGVPYELHPVDIGKGQQFEPAFLKISPNNRIPAIVDPDGPGGMLPSLYAFGQFTSIGGVNIRGIAKWNGAACGRYWRVGNFGLQHLCHPPILTLSLRMALLP